jgi:hypothetical protein
MGADGGPYRPDDQMRERVSGSSLGLWFLLDASRWLVAALVLVAVGGGVVVALWVDPAPVRDAVETADPVETLFQALLTAIVTGVTLAVSINTLVLSQELGAVGEQRERMSESISFRSDVAEELSVPAGPPEPAAFLRSLVDLASERAREFEDAVGRNNDGQVRERVEIYVGDLVENADAVDTRLDGAQFGSFDVISAVLDFNYSWKLYEAHRLRSEHESEFDDAATGALDGLVDALRLYGTTREHIKTLYFQWELINLSRAMLYAAVPALLVSVAGILTLDNPGSVPGMTFGVANLGWVVVTATLVALAPFAILLAYVLRLATVAKRTLAIGPFVLRETDRTDHIEWGDDEH